MKKAMEHPKLKQYKKFTKSSYIVHTNKHRTNKEEKGLHPTKRNNAIRDFLFEMKEV